MTPSYALVETPTVQAAVRPGSGRASGWWIEAFVLFQIVCQIAILVSFLSPLRSLVRIAGFGASLALLVMLPGRGAAHPAARAAQWAVLIVGVSVARSFESGLLAAIAQFAMYLAVLAPLFWVKRLALDSRALQRVFLMLWIFHSASAALGILQVYFPNQFQPRLSAVYANGDTSILEGLQIQTDSGERVFRPMGLTDVPGGAATGGFYAVLLGAGLFLNARRQAMRILCTGSMLAGFACVYLCETRSILVMLGLCLVGLCALLSWRGEHAKFATMTGLLTILTLAAFTWAMTLTAGSIAKRFGTLVEGNPSDVYHNNRGIFLDHTIHDLLPEYPLGAGPGRWGMINYYFGDRTGDHDQRPFWVEIQWTGWLLDGGVPLVVAYTAAVLIALKTAWTVATARGQGRLWMWGAVMTAYNIGALAVTFNNPYFHGQGGLECWLLNAALFSVWHRAQKNGRLLGNA